MKQKLFYLIIILITFSLCGKSQIEYTDIPRTRVSIQIPEGYEILDNAIGLHKGDDHMIMIMDLVGGNYYTNTKDFNKKTFELQGMEVYEFEETEVAGCPAKFIRSNTDDENLGSFTLVFGDTTFSTMILSLYPIKGKKHENELREIILSVKYDKRKIIDPFEGVKFTVDTVITDFKFAVFSSNMYVFTPFGKDNSKDEPLIMLMPTAFDKSMTLKQVSQMSINSLQKHGMYGFITDSTSTYKIDDYDALLTIGDLYSGIDKKYYYQLILVKKDLCLVIQGLCPFDEEDDKINIKKFCKEIRLTN